MLTERVDSRSSEGGTETFGARLSRAASRVPVDLPLAVLDVLLIAASYATVLVARFDGSVPSAWWTRFAVFAPAACVTHVAATRIFAGHEPWRRPATLA